MNRAPAALNAPLSQDFTGFQKLDLSGFQHCAAHFERMMQRPSVQQLLAFEKSVQDEFAKAA